MKRKPRQSDNFTRAVFTSTGSTFMDELGIPTTVIGPVYPKRAIWHELLKMAWERGEYQWTGQLQTLLRRAAC